MLTMKMSECKKASQFSTLAYSISNRYIYFQQTHTKYVIHIRIQRENGINRFQFKFESFQNDLLIV